MFDDGLVMDLVDGAMVGCLGIAAAFLGLYGVRVRWERSVIGWLIVGNTLGWAAVCVGGVLYRLDRPDAAQWFFLPLAVAVPAVMLTWLVLLLRGRPSTDSLVERWRQEGWELSQLPGRCGEAALAFRHADELRGARPDPPQDAPLT